MIKEVLLEYFSCLSRFLNVMLGGSADMTFSARSHRDGWWTERVIDWFALKLFKEADHCARWWRNEVERCRRTVALAEERGDA